MLEDSSISKQKSLDFLGLVEQLLCDLMCVALACKIGLCRSEQLLERFRLLAVFLELQSRESPREQKTEKWESVSEVGGGRGSGGER